MAEKLFGGTTEEEQFQYLRPKILALGVALVSVVIGFLLGVLGVITKAEIFIGAAELFASLAGTIAVIDLYIFGWAIMRGLFGITSLGILFSNNVVLGVVIFVLYMLAGYIGGLVVAVIGLCRFLVLLKHRKK